MKQYSKIFFFFPVVFLSAMAITQAQTVRDTLSGGVVLVKDARLDSLIEKQTDMNERILSRKPQKGFRVQVMNTTDREQVIIAKSKLLQYFPEHRTYLIYQSPYFKLRIGNFIDRKEAEKLRNEILPYFPTGVFVIPSEVIVKPEQLITGQ